MKRATPYTQAEREARRLLSALFFRCAACGSVAAKRAADVSSSSDIPKCCGATMPIVRADPPGPIDAFRAAQAIRGQNARA